MVGEARPHLRSPRDQVEQCRTAYPYEVAPEPTGAAEELAEGVRVCTGSLLEQPVKQQPPDSRGPPVEPITTVLHSSRYASSRSAARSSSN
jgi:hypothetical protein